MTAKYSFSARLSLNILLITSILFTLAIAIAAASSHILIANEAEKSAENLRDKTITEIEATLQSVELATSSMEWLVKESLDNPDYLYHITQELVRNNPNIMGSAIAFKSNYYEGKHFFSPYSYVDYETGEIESKQLGNPSYDYFYMDWYQIPLLLGTPVWSEPYFDEGGGEFLMSTYSRPLLDENGEIFAILTADIQLDWISNMLTKIKPYPSSRVIMLSRCGNFISLGSDDSLDGETVFSVEQSYRNMLRGIHEISVAQMNDEVGTKKYSVNGDVQFVVFAPISNGWKMSIICSYREVLARASEMHMVLILIGLIGLLVLFILCYRTIRRLTKPLSDFTSAAQSIAQGNFNTMLPAIKSEDEILQLKNSFDYMQKSLTSYIENLKTTTAANERYESELNIAAKIQMSMVPHTFPEDSRFDISAILAPAREVGGDLYDFFIKGDNLYIAVGDVSGKGVPAALIMSITKAAFRFIAGMEVPMKEVASQINNALSSGNETGMFVTLFVARINLNTGHMEYCNCGHNPIVILTPDGRSSFLNVKPNLAVGLFENFPYVSQETDLKSNTGLVLYTDGVTEAERADKSQYSDAALLKWAEQIGIDKDADTACKDLMQSVRDFTEGNDQNDDITIMTVKIK